jgi:D-psicose/D-tagatose/L-ribulose 3-epimerase
MRLGMNLLLWTTRVTEEHFPLFAKLRQIGFDGVELPLAVDQPESHYRRVRRELERCGLRCTTVTLVDATTNPISSDAEVRRAAVERLKWAVGTTATLGGEVMCGPFHSAYKVFVGRGPNEDEKRWGADVLREAGEAAAAAKVRLGVEFLNRFECYFLNTTADACDLVERVGRPEVQVLYDTHHAHLEEKDVVRAITAGAKSIGHVHVSENDRGTPGRGQVRWRETFESLKRIGYDGWLVIEAFSRLDPAFAAAIHIWRDFFGSPDEVARDGHRFIRDEWQKARG